jgi:hypothetical protein
LPSLPPGVSRAEFGQNIMRWGSGDAAARERMSTLTREELIEAGVTLEMAREWRELYLREKARNPNNPSAAGRADLMQRTVELLEDEL